MIGRTLQPRERVGPFQIEKILNRGSFANAYRAVGDDGTPVFLKQYLLHPMETPWFEAWRQHQEELWIRVEASVRELTYRRAAFFLADAIHGVMGRDGHQMTLTLDPPSYFQCYEFVTGVRHIGGGLVRGDRESAGMSLPERLRIARIFLLALRRLHDAGIVHTDLKPDNVVLRPAPSTKAGYMVQLVDLDWSLLVDRPVPWAGAEGSWAMGVVGTLGWMSPEHLLGEVPVTASDIFTTGLILYELLGDRHPYAGEGGTNLKEIMSFAAPLPEVEMPWVSESVRQNGLKTIRQALAPVAGDRPTAQELFDALVTFAPPAEAEPAPAARPAPPASPVAAAPAPPRPVAPVPPADAAAITPASPLRLVAANGVTIQSRAPLSLNAALLSRCGDDAVHWDAVEQCRITPGPTGWVVTPRAGTRNATTCNEIALAAPRVLAAGDVLAVGNVAKGIFKLPLQVG